MYMSILLDPFQCLCGSRLSLNVFPVASRVIAEPTGNKFNLCRPGRCLVVGFDGMSRKCNATGCLVGG